jgi:hypothetical protein
MLAMCRQLGFEVLPDPADATVRVAKFEVQLRHTHR